MVSGCRHGVCFRISTLLRLLAVGVVVWTDHDFFGLLHVGAFMNSMPGASISSYRTFRRERVLTKATWSNGQAIREYQEFLSSGRLQPDLTPDCPSVILTDGSNTPLVNTLQQLGLGDDMVLSVEGGTYPPLPPTVGGSAATPASLSSYPIYIALSPSSLSTFLANVPPDYIDRNEDFVFFSGGPSCGCIEPTLRRYSYARDSMTQVLISGVSLVQGEEAGPTSTPPRMRTIRDLSVTIGVDAQGQEKYAGECRVCGKWQGAMAERMERNMVRCRVSSYREWRRYMWERAAYDAVFSLVGAIRTDPTSIADVATYYEAEVSDMLWQISSLLRGSLAVTMIYGFEDRLFSLAELTGKDTPCTLDDRQYDSTYAMFEGCPMIAEYLVYAQQERNLLQSTKLPDTMMRGKVELGNIMRKGNLRADGVV